MLPGVAGGPCNAATRVINGVVRDVVSDCAGCLAERCADARAASTGDCLVCSGGVPGVTDTCGSALDTYCSPGVPPPPAPEPVDACAPNAASCSCSQCDCSSSSSWPCGGGGGGCACAGTHYCSCGGYCHPVVGYPCAGGSGHRRLTNKHTHGAWAMSVGDLLQVSGMLLTAAATTPSH